MEYEEFVGYNHSSKRYVVHGMSIEGDEDPSEGFCYAYRTGNEFKTVAKFGSDSFIVQRFTLQTAYRAITNADSWNIKSAWVIAGKEGEPFLEMQLCITPTPKKTKDFFDLLPQKNRAAFREAPCKIFSAGLLPSVLPSLDKSI